MFPFAQDRMTQQKRKMDESGEEIKEEEDNGKKMKIYV